MGMAHSSVSPGISKPKRSVGVGRQKENQWLQKERAVHEGRVQSLHLHACLPCSLATSLPCFDGAWQPAMAKCPRCASGSAGTSPS